MAESSDLRVARKINLDQATQASEYVFAIDDSPRDFVDRHLKGGRRWVRLPTDRTSH